MSNCRAFSQPLGLGPAPGAVELGQGAFGCVFLTRWLCLQIWGEISKRVSDPNYCV